MPSLHRRRRRGGHRALYMLAKTFRQMLVILERNVRDSRALWQALWQGFRVPPFAAEDIIARPPLQVEARVDQPPSRRVARRPTWPCAPIPPASAWCWKTGARSDRRTEAAVGGWCRTNCRCSRCRHVGFTTETQSHREWRRLLFLHSDFLCDSVVRRRASVENEIPRRSAASNTSDGHCCLPRAHRLPWPLELTAETLRRLHLAHHVHRTHSKISTFP